MPIDKNIFIRDILKELEEEILSFGKELDLELTDMNAVTKVTY